MSAALTKRHAEAAAKTVRRQLLRREFRWDDAGQGGTWQFITSHRTKLEQAKK